MLKKNCYILLLTLFCHHANAQQVRVLKTIPLKENSLYREVLKADSLLFDAFNRCDSITYKKFFTPDLEFYHDQGGLNVGLDKELQSFKEMCKRGTQMRRQGTVEVHPIKGYGALETGVHQFYHTNPSQSEKLSGTYKFVHLWKLDNGLWKLARVISYGHDDVHNE